MRTNTLQDASATPDHQTAIAARAHQIWKESGRVHGQDAQHWRQAEREHYDVEARAVAVEQFNAEPSEAGPAKAARRRVARVVEPEAEVLAALARKPRAVHKVETVAR